MRGFKLLGVMVSAGLLAAGCLLPQADGIDEPGSDGGIRNTTQPDASRTTTPTPDAQVADATIDAAPPPPCTPVGGNTTLSDPATGNCYMLYDIALPYTDAATMCSGMGAKVHLATLTSQTEHDLVLGLAGASEAWIGFSDELTEGSFLWINGEPTLFTTWALGEPNNGGGAIENCTITNKTDGDGKWDDRPCATPMPYICERDR